MSKLEYLDENYKLHVIDGENDAVPEGWLLVPVGAEVLNESRIGLIFYKKNKSKTKLDSSFLFMRVENDLWDTTSTDPHDIDGEFFKAMLWQRESKSEVVEDVVNQPSHYNKGGVECIYAIESSMTKEAFCGYLKGNVQKYMWRYENKGGVESLKKAQWYLNKLIEVEGK